MIPIFAIPRLKETARRSINWASVPAPALRSTYCDYRFEYEHPSRNWKVTITHSATGKITQFPMRNRLLKLEYFRSFPPSDVLSLNDITQTYRQMILNHLGIWFKTGPTTSWSASSPPRYLGFGPLDYDVRGKFLVGSDRGWEKVSVIDHERNWSEQQFGPAPPPSYYWVVPGFTTTTLRMSSGSLESFRRYHQVPESRIGNVKFKVQKNGKSRGAELTDFDVTDPVVVLKVDRYPKLLTFRFPDCWDEYGEQAEEGMVFDFAGQHNDFLRLIIS